MYNANKPSLNELPSTAALLRSTILAILGAALILVMIVLPSEYGIDPTGVGGVLGLTDMGQIKVQLAAEAEAARRLESGAENVATQEAPVEAAERAARLAAQPAAQPNAEPETRSDEVSLELAPGEGRELKLVMTAGAQADFHWTANGGLLNYDQHGDGGGQKVSYQKGRGEPEGNGVMEAAFDGNHGWFWRNRTDAVVQLTLRTSGAYLELIGMP